MVIRLQDQLNSAEGLQRIQTQTQFGTMLTQKGIQKKPSNGRTLRLGLELKLLLETKGNNTAGPVGKENHEL